METRVLVILDSTGPCRILGSFYEILFLIENNLAIPNVQDLATSFRPLKQMVSAIGTLVPFPLEPTPLMCLGFFKASFIRKAPLSQVRTVRKTHTKNLFKLIIA